MISQRGKQRVFELLEPAQFGDCMSRAFDLAIICLLAVNVMGAILRTVGRFSQSYGTFFDLCEYATVAVFTTEYLARLWVSDLQGKAPCLTPNAKRVRYVLSPHGLVDLLAFLPFYVTLLVTVDSRLAHVLPVLRVLKYIRYSPALETLGMVVYNERRTLTAAAVIMLVLLLFSSSLIYLVENNAQPNVFDSIPAAMWWGIATLTTVGYGDVTPITPLGKFLGSIVTVLGIGMFAFPAGILATGFAQEIKQREFIVTWNLVASVPLFRGLNAEEIARIARLLLPQIVQPGQLVVRQGDTADRMFFIVSGELEVEINATIAPMQGDFFGEIALLTEGTRSASVRAVTSAQLLVLHAKHFRTILSDNPHIAETLSRSPRSGSWPRNNPCPGPSGVTKGECE